MNTQTLRLDVSKDTVTQPPVVLGQGDRNGTTIKAVIYDNGTLLTQTGLSARLKMRLPDGAHYYIKSATWTASTGTVVVTVDETQAASVVGLTHECYFELYTGSASSPTVIYSTSRFDVRVLRSANEGTVPATSYDDRVEDAIADAVAATSAANTAASSANSAATKATNAATSATNAASSANSAATSATNAASSANTAASSANTARTNANNAASAANTAAGTANTAASNANTATANANTARDNANAAAGRADTATANANAARDNANAAATRADTATDDATDAAADARLAADQARGAISANLRFTLAVREYHDGTHRLCIIDAGEEE